jgi:hypothetical protein
MHAAIGEIEDESPRKDAKRHKNELRVLKLSPGSHKCKALIALWLFVFLVAIPITLFAAFKYGKMR